MSELTLSDIMSPITVAFKQRSANLIKTGNKGSVLFIRKNSELEEPKTTTYKSAVFTIDDKVLEAQIKQVFKGTAQKVIVLEYKTSLSDVVSTMGELEWNWVFSLEETDQAEITAYAKENKKFALVYNQNADSMYVVSINNPSAILSEDNTTIEKTALLPILAGTIAGCPYTMSISYKIFDELKEVTLPETIAEGQITLYKEEEGIRIASPVNTLLTLTSDITEDMKSIAIAEGMKRLEEDAKYCFRTAYKGKYKNSYDNQCLFLSAFNYYLEQLEGLGILDPDYNNKADIDTDKQRSMWIASGKNPDTINAMSELEIKELTYKNLFYPRIDCKFLDAIEGMQMTVEMY